MQKNHAYIFATKEQARKFQKAIWHGGFESKLVGTAVLTDDRVFDWAANYYCIDTADEPVWMSENY